MDTERSWRQVLPALGLAGSIVLCLAVTWACSAGLAAVPATPVAASPATAPAGPQVEPHASWDEAILYFVILDRFADGDLSNDRDVRPGAKGTFHGGDLPGLAGELDELADLGVTALWITPVVRNVPGFVTGAGFPDWAYHGYWADDFTRLDPRFGTEEELSALVDAAHARGIAVLLDVVYNHAGYGSRYLSDPATRGWLRSEDAGTCGSDDLTACVAGLPDFRTELPLVADYLMDAHLGLAARVGLDGFRLDTVKHVSHEFWRRHRERVGRELGEGFFLLGEVWGGDAQVLDPWFAGDELDAGFDFGFAGSTLAFLQGRGRTVAFERYLESRQAVRTGHLLAHYLSSHDVPTALSLLGGDLELFRLAALLQLTVRGIPVVFYGEEVGRFGGAWPENRSDMPWGERDVPPGAGLPRNEALRADYRRLIALRRAHPALWRGEHSGLSTEGDLLLFLRWDRGTADAVVVAVNRGAEPASARIETPEPWTGAASVIDAWNDVPIPVAGGAIDLAVPPRSARILTKGEED
jgi:alpha-amylase